MQPFRLVGPKAGMQVGRVDAVTPDHGAELAEPCFNQTARPASRGWSAQAAESGGEPGQARTADRRILRMSVLLSRGSPLRHGGDIFVACGRGVTRE